MLAAALCVMAWTLADHEADARARPADRSLLRRALRRLHVLPRRARGSEAGAAIPDAVLPDDLAGRRARLGAGRHRRAAGAARVLRARGRARRDGIAAALAGAARPSRIRSTRHGSGADDGRLRGMGHRRVLQGHHRHRAQLLRRAAGAGAWPGQRQPSPVAGPRHDTPWHAVSGQRAEPTPDHVLHEHVGRRTRARIAASLDDADQGRRDRPRHGNAGHLRRQGRCLSLLRDQSGRARNRATRLHVSARQRRDHRARARRRASVAGARAERRSSTCW